MNTKYFKLYVLIDFDIFLCFIEPSVSHICYFNFSSSHLYVNQYWIILEFLTCLFQLSGIVAKCNPLNRAEK